MKESVGEESRRKPSEFEEARTYWEQILSGEARGVALPKNQKQKDTANVIVDEVNLNLSEELNQMMIKFCKQNDLVFHTILLGGLFLFLYKCTQKKEILLASPNFTRSKEPYSMEEGVIFESQIQEEQLINELLNQTKETIARGYKYQYYPLSKLLEEMDYGQNEISPFATMLWIQNLHSQDGLNAMRDMFHIHMVFCFQRNETDIYGKIQYDGACYTKKIVKSFGERYLYVLSQMLTNLHTQVSEISLMTKEETQKVLYTKTKDTCQEEKKTIHKLFEEQVKRTPDQIALICKEETMTYQDLEARANHFANHLIHRNSWKEETLVVVLLDKSFELIQAFLGILKAGGTYVPIHVNYPIKRIARTIQDAGIEHIVTIHLYHEIVETLLKECTALTDVIYMDDEWQNDWEENVLEETSIEVKPENSAYVIYTSGTTGQPKGTIIEHRNVVSLMESGKILFDFDEFDVWTMFHSPCFDFSVWEMYGALLFGGKLVLIPNEDAKNAKEFLHILREKKVTILNQTPSSFYQLSDLELELEDHDLKIRTIIFGGEALKPNLLRHWKMKYGDTKFINMYGITETCVHVTYKMITEEDMKLKVSNIGKVIPTLKEYIFDEHKNLLPDGLIGELYIGGRGVARGYLKKEELTMSRFIENPYVKGERIYKTGDYVRRMENGELEYCGRIDQQVKIRGFRIELGEIEYCLSEIDGIKEVVALCGENEDNEKFIGCCFVGNQVFETNQLREYVLDKLPEYMVPSYFVQLDEIPLNQNGKVDRKKLLKEWNKGRQTKEYVPPRNELEQRLEEIWKAVLELDRVSIEDDFFELGGHSLRAIKLEVEMEKNDFSIEYLDIYKYRTIKEYARYLQERGLEDGTKDIDESD